MPHVSKFKLFALIPLWLLCFVRADLLSAAEPVEYPQISRFKVMEGDNMLWSQPEYADNGWDTALSESVNPQGKILWVRGRFDLSANFDVEQTPLGLFIYGAMSSEIWLNGEIVGRNGRPASSAVEEVPGNMYTSFYVAPGMLRDTDNVLAIRMSSYNLRKPLSTPIHCICFGRYEDPESRYLRYYSPTLLTSSALLLGAIYFAWLFAIGPRKRSNLALSLMSFSLLAQMVAEISRAFISYQYPQHLLRLDLIQAFAMLSGLALVWYLTERYAKALTWPAVLLTLVLMAGAYLSFNGYDSKTQYSIIAAVTVALGVAGMAAFQKKRSATVTAIGLGLLWCLFLYNPFTFLDLNYYFGAAFLIILLFVQQAMMLRHSQKDAEQTALRASRLELEILKRHIQPHFLLNTLTALSELIESAPAKGVQMIEALAEEFRVLLAISHRQLIDLDSEIDLCRCHLEVMSLRKERSFKLKIIGSPAGLRVPPGVLHTLVENALFHNAYKGDIEFQLIIHSKEDSWHYLRFQVPLIESERRSETSGMGHSYIKARLQEAFGQDWNFTSGPQEDDQWLDEIGFKGKP